MRPAVGARPSLQGCTPEDLVAAVPELNLREARRVVAAFFRGGPAALDAAIPHVRAIALEDLRAAFDARALRLAERQRSAVDPFEKYLFEAADGARVEAVRIPLEQPDRFTVCVSSQVGCALGCAFCATGRLGLRRNLEAWEIVDQIRQIRDRLPAGARVHGVVFQGMGEPLANLDRVLAAIRALKEPSGLAIRSRAITVSTAGLPSGIRRLAREAPRVRLALSIASARAAQRRRLMPIDGAHPLPEVLDAAVEHARATGHAPMFAITLLRGVNDDADEAAALAALILDFEARAGVRPRLSVIAYNAIDGDPAADPFRRASAATEAAFRDALAAHGVRSHRRYSGGGDIAAACGQLAGASRPA
ncbi:MAG: radical SAM protein [Nannocystaceae bacterium]